MLLLNVPSAFCLACVLPQEMHPIIDRRGFLLGTLLQPAPVAADDKLRNLPAARMAEIIQADLVERQFLATADFTREIYDEGATFTDEIDTYTLPKFVKGTSALFVKEKSQVRLVGEVQADAQQVVFRFDEDLCFNIPLNPVVTVTGRCVLTRDAESGLIVKYREYWDKTPTEVLKTAFGRPKKA